jgi:endonuclease/exonuclease/phosphatase family metal-dependent hydrolase
MSIRLMSLNIAHGRRLGPNQVLQSRARIQRNLAAIAAIVTRERPHVVALQEADGPSLWSGRFDHVAHIATTLGYPWHFRGNHAPPLTGLDYGTALLSPQPLHNARSRPFHQNWRDAKGFVEATLETESGSVDIVSVHFDFLRKEIRRRQMLALYDRFEQARRPVVLLGDFNCQWSSGLAEFAERLDLHAWHPDRRDPTYPSQRPLLRLDWALASQALCFRDCRILPDRVSDHLGLLVELDWS